MSWEPADLAQLEPRPAIRPDVGEVGLIYPGKRHLLSGPPESAKTLAAYAIALEVVRRRTGGSVLLIDFEMGSYDARDRLREMGASDEELARIFYVEPETPASEKIVENLAAVEALELVVVDAAAGAYALQGLDDNKRGDVEAFAKLYVRAFHRRGIATIVVDHVSKKSGGRGAFAIGSERKLGGVDVHLGFEAALPLRRGGRGLYKITTHKDRLGHLERPRAAELELRSDPGTHAISWTFRAPEPAVEGTPWQPTRLMEKVSIWLETRADAVPRNEVERNVSGRAEYVRSALDALIAEGFVRESTGRAKSRPVRSIRAYRETSASERVPSASGTQSDPGDTTASPRPPLYEGDADAVVDADEIERLAELARNGGDDLQLTADDLGFEEGS